MITAPSLTVENAACQQAAARAGVFFPKIVRRRVGFLRDFVPVGGHVWWAGALVLEWRLSRKSKTSGRLFRRPTNDQADPAGGRASPTFRRDACRVRSELERWEVWQSPMDRKQSG